MSSIGFSKEWKQDCKREGLEKSEPVTRFKYTPITLLVCTIYLVICVLVLCSPPPHPQCLAALTIHPVDFHSLNEQLNE